MGYVSCYESALDRLSQALYDSEVYSDATTRRRLEAAIADARKLLPALRKYEQIATDPDIDLAARVVELERSNARLQSERAVQEVETGEVRRQLVETSQRCKALEEEVVRLKVELGGKRADVNELARTRKRLEREISRLRRGR